LSRRWYFAIIETVEKIINGLDFSDYNNDYTDFVLIEDFPP